MDKNKTLKKILIKLSGETLSNDNFIFDFKKVEAIAKEIKDIYKLGTKIGIVVGGGNIFRGRMVENNEIGRVESDTMGMLATILNGLCLETVFKQNGMKSRALASVAIEGVVEKYSNKKANEYWNNDEVLVFCGGTGNPFFTTDTAAVLKAVEMKVDAVLKTTQVDGVYDKDPNKFKDAKKYKNLSYQEALEKKLKIMDLTAFALAMDNNMRIRVFKNEKGNLLKAVKGEDIGTTVS